MNRALPVLTRAAVCLVVGGAFIAACGDSPASPAAASPTPASPLPAPSATPTSSTYTLSGVVTDAGSHIGIAGARVEAINLGSATTTDNTGAYTFRNVSPFNTRLRASAFGHDAREQIIDVFLNSRADFQLPPQVAPSANYEGVWTGEYGVTDCRDIDVPGLTQFHLCPRPSQFYQFTLTQIGTLVSGTYKLVTSFYSCPCQLDGGYGEIPMAGSISPDGTLAITALGNTRGLVGATAELDLLLRQTSPSTITGTDSRRLMVRML